MSSLSPGQINALEKFYTRSAAATYAGNGEVTADAKSNAYIYEYTEGDLVYIDRYVVNDIHIYGGVTIWDSSISKDPLWIMKYQGYTVEGDFTVDFLKEVLSSTYNAQVFNGGRGEKEVRKKISEGVTLMYRNNTVEHHLGYFGGLIL